MEISAMRVDILVIAIKLQSFCEPAGPRQWFTAELIYLRHETYLYKVYDFVNLKKHVH